MIFGSSLIRVLHPCVVIMMFSCLLGSCKVGVKTEHEEIEEMNFELTIAQAEKLVSLPLNCVTKPFPYKSGHVLSKKNDLDLPQVHHPAFYGCFDWHSSVHGHWVMVYLLKRFPEMNQADTVMIILKDHFRSENIAREIDYFDMNRYTASFERTYGWAWLLKLANELESWDNPEATQLFKNLKPLADLICQKYMEYLPKLNYPIRVGEHSNTAFGLTFAYDYAANTGQDSLLELISKRARDYYLYDRNCPSSWEPSGYDFLSPCLEEADIMRRILEREKFKSWLGIFLPDLLKVSIPYLILCRSVIVLMVNSYTLMD